MPITYIQGAELPDVEITWMDSDGSVIDFSTGWTFTVRIGVLGQPASMEKTDGITGNAVAPNVVVIWDNVELENLPAAAYALQVIARHTASGKDRKFTDTLTIDPQVLPPTP